MPDVIGLFHGTVHCWLGAGAHVRAAGTKPDGAAGAPAWAARDSDFCQLEQFLIPVCVVNQWIVAGSTWMCFVLVAVGFPFLAQFRSFSCSKLCRFSFKNSNFGWCFSSGIFWKKKSKNLNFANFVQEPFIL